MTPFSTLSRACVLLGVAPHGVPVLRPEPQARPREEVEQVRLQVRKAPRFRGPNPKPGRAKRSKRSDCRSTGRPGSAGRTPSPATRKGRRGPTLCTSRCAAARLSAICEINARPAWVLPPPARPPPLPPPTNVESAQRGAPRAKSGHGTARSRQRTKSGVYFGAASRRAQIHHWSGGERGGGAPGRRAAKIKAGGSTEAADRRKRARAFILQIAVRGVYARRTSAKKGGLLEARTRSSGLVSAQ